MSFSKEVFVPGYYSADGACGDATGLTVNVENITDTVLIPGAKGSFFEGDAFLTGTDTKALAFQGTSMAGHVNPDVNTLFIGTNNFDPNNIPTGFDEIVFSDSIRNVNDVVNNLPADVANIVAPASPLPSAVVFVAAVALTASTVMWRQAAYNRRLEAAGYGVKMSGAKAMALVAKDRIAKNHTAVKQAFTKLTEKIHSR